MPHDLLPGEAGIVVSDLPVALLGYFFIYSASNTHFLISQSSSRALGEACAVRLP